MVLIVFVLSALNVATVSAATSVPEKLIYEARLLDSVTSDPLLTGHTFRFSFWITSPVDVGDVVAGAIDPLAINFGGWQEVQTVTPNDLGFVSFELGAISVLPEIDYTEHLYLQVEIKAAGDLDTSYEILDRDPLNPLSDRAPVGSVPYALNADMVDNAEIGTNDGDIVLLGPGGVLSTSVIPGGTEEDIFVLDDDDSSVTNISLQFGDTLGQILEYDLVNTRFEFTDDLYIQGALAIEGESFSVNVDGTAADSSLDFNAGAANLLYSNGTDEFIFSDAVNVTGDLDTTGNITVTGTVDGVDVSSIGAQAHDQNTDTGSSTNTFILDTDDTGGDIGIQFGTTLTEVIGWEDASSRFSISDDLYVDGTLEVNGNIDFNQNLAVEMVLDQGVAFPGAPIEGQTFYRTDLNALYIYDGLSWVAFADASGSNSMFLSPNYPNVTFFGDGVDNTGQLTYYFDDINIENAYRWESTKNSIQDYDVKVRIQVPDNFSSWDAVNPIEFKYKTDTTLLADNQLDFTMLDTTDAAVTMSNNAVLVSAVADTWVESTDMTITGGTWTPGSWFTITIKLTTKNTGGAEAGSLVLNYNTSS